MGRLVEEKHIRADVQGSLWPPKITTNLVRDSREVVNIRVGKLKLAQKKKTRPRGVR